MTGSGDLVYKCATGDSYTTRKRTKSVTVLSVPI